MENMREVQRALLKECSQKGIQSESWDYFLNYALRREMERPVVITKGIVADLSDYYIIDNNPSDAELYKQAGTRKLVLRSNAKITFAEDYEVDPSLAGTTVTKNVIINEIPKYTDNMILNGHSNIFGIHLEKPHKIVLSTGNSLASIIESTINSDIDFEDEDITGDDIQTKKKIKAQMLPQKLTLKSMKSNLNISVGDFVEITASVFRGSKSLGSTLVNLGFQQEEVTEKLGLRYALLLDYSVTDKDVGEKEVRSFELSEYTRREMNNRLSYKRVIGKTLSRDIKLEVGQGETILSGTVISEDVFKKIERLPIIHVESSAGETPIVNNGFCNTIKLFEELSIPLSILPDSFLLYKHTESKPNIADINYNLFMEIYQKLENSENTLELGNQIKVNQNELLGKTLLPMDILSMANCHSAFMDGVEEEDDIDALDMITAATINDIFIEYIRESIHGGGIKGASFKDIIRKLLSGYNDSENLANKLHENIAFKVPEVAYVTKRIMTSELKDFDDLINPFSEVSLRKKVSKQDVRDRGGIKAKGAVSEARSLNPSFLGRIDCVETPEGKVVGLVNHLTAFSKVNCYGEIEAPFLRVTESGIDFSEIIWMSYDQEKKYVRAIPDIGTEDKVTILITKNGITVHKKEIPLTLNETKSVNKKMYEIMAEQLKDEFGGDSYRVKVSRDGWFSEDIIDAVTGHGNFIKANWNEIDYVLATPDIYSPVIGSIPFLKNNDNVREQMAASMRTQAVALMNPDAPLVKTSYNRMIAREAGVLAKDNGTVVAADSHLVTVRYPEGEVNYTLEQGRKTPQHSTLYKQVPNVKRGDLVEKGDVIINTNATSGETVTLGRNILVAYMPFEGLNYEDAIGMSVSCAHKHNAYATIHSSEEVIEYKNDVLSNKAIEDLKELIKPVGTVVEPDGSIGKKLRYVRGAETFEEIKNEKFVPVTITNVNIIKTDDSVSIKVDLRHIARITEGDKFAGNHGNKGVISKVINDCDMPRLEDGTPIDAVLSPLGVPSRMNVAQLLEASLGKYCKDRGLIAEIVKDVEIETLKSVLQTFEGTDKIRLIDGRTGQYFKEKVFVGVVEFYKLVHIAQTKLHARRNSTSRHNYDKLDQPRGGGKSNGGQRVGEMEHCSFMSMGISDVAAELRHLSSDDMTNREAFQNELLNKPVADIDIVQNMPMVQRESRAYMRTMFRDVVEYDEKGEVIDFRSPKVLKPGKSLVPQPNRNINETNDFFIMKRNEYIGQSTEGSLFEILEEREADGVMSGTSGIEINRDQIIIKKATDAITNSIPKPEPPKLSTIPRKVDPTEIAEDLSNTLDMFGLDFLNLDGLDTTMDTNQKRNTIIPQEIRREEGNEESTEEIIEDIEIDLGIIETTESEFISLEEELGIEEMEEGTYEYEEEDRSYEGN